MKHLIALILLCTTLVANSAESTSLADAQWAASGYYSYPVVVTRFKAGEDIFIVTRQDKYQIWIYSDYNIIGRSEPNPSTCIFCYPTYTYIILAPNLAYGAEINRHLAILANYANANRLMWRYGACYNNLYGCLN